MHRAQEAEVVKECGIDYILLTEARQKNKILTRRLIALLKQEDELRRRLDSREMEIKRLERTVAAAIKFHDEIRLDPDFKPRLRSYHAFVFHLNRHRGRKHG